MADFIQDIFQNRTVREEKLLHFGFQKKGAFYVYDTILSESGFSLFVTVTKEGSIGAELIDPSFGEPYTLHLVEGASGSFVGEIRNQLETILKEIAEKCFDWTVFQSLQTKEIMAYIEKTYGDRLEFLWKDVSDNAVWRRKDTGKWYGVLLKVSKRKLGLPSDERAEILDFHIKPDVLASLIDHQKYFPGFHMNKKHWGTIILDHSVPTEEICRRIDDSYLLAVK